MILRRAILVAAIARSHHFVCAVVHHSGSGAFPGAQRLSPGSLAEYRFSLATLLPF
jgi:hypothetical protein